KRRAKEDSVLVDTRDFRRDDVAAAQVQRLALAAGLSRLIAAQRRERTYDETAGALRRRRRPALDRPRRRRRRLLVDDASRDSRAQGARGGTSLWLPDQAACPGLLMAVHQPAGQASSVELEHTRLSPDGRGSLRRTEHDQRPKTIKRQAQGLLDPGNRQHEGVFFHLPQGTAETRAVLVDGCERTVPGLAGAGQEYAGDLILGDPRFALCIADHEGLRRSIEPADLSIHDRAVIPVDPGLIALDLARGLAVPSTDPQSFQPQVSAPVGQREAAQHLRYTPGNLQISKLLACRIENQDPTFLLIEIDNQVNAPLSLTDLTHGCHVGFLFGLALDDQVSFPDLEPEPALDRFFVLADPQREDKIRFVLPGELEFESRPGGKLEITANCGALLVRPGLPLFFLPATLVRGLLPAPQSIWPQINQVGTRFPAVHPVDDGALDVQPPEPCNFELGLLVVHGKQRAEDN